MNKTCGLTLPRYLETGIIYLKQIDQALKLTYTNLGSNRWTISTQDLNLEDLGNVNATSKLVGNLMEIIEDNVDNDLNLIHYIYQCGEDYYLDLVDDQGIKSTHYLDNAATIRRAKPEFKPDTREKLKAAVNLWNDERTKAKEQYGDISDWDTSNVTDMTDLFDGISKFNDDISKWNTDKVTTMEGMFRGAIGLSLIHI